MNNRREWLEDRFRNRWPGNLLLVLALALFSLLLAAEIQRRFSG